MNIAYVICCNDHIETVVIDDEELANKELERIKKEDYERCPKYREQRFWHMHEVKIIN